MVASPSTYGLSSDSLVKRSVSFGRSVHATAYQSSASMSMAASRQAANKHASRSAVGYRVHPVPAQTSHSQNATRLTLADDKLLIDRPVIGVTRLTISNPAKRNALDHPILDAITATLGELAAGAEEGPGAVAAADAPARCVIITGAHGMFSAGYDIGEIPEEEFELRAESLVAHPFTQAIDTLEAFPYPTLAVLPGHTIGGGLELALACDLRVAKDDIELGMPPAKLGLVYSHTGIRRFLDTIGAARTRELFLLGRNIDAATALSWGLVNRTASERELDPVGLEVAAEMAGNAPLSQLGNKRVIAALLRDQAGLPERVEQELIELRRASFATEDMREGMRAFAEKRPPRWRGE
jgi:enoyl-CoA hydratase/carnithine racemase